MELIVGVAALFSIKRPKEFTFKLWGTVTLYVFRTLCGISEAKLFMVMAPIVFIGGIILFVIGMRYL